MIPKLHYISQAPTAAKHIEQVQKACSAGAELVQLELEHILENERLTLAQEVIAITSHFQTRLIIKSHYKLAHQIKADGVFLENKDSSIAHVRQKLYTWQTIGAAAHTLEDCESLIASEVDYIILKPFKSTDHSELKALELEGYKAIADVLNTKTPLIGYGAITTSDVTAIMESGIEGIAVSDAINENFDSIKTFHQLLNASATQEQRHTFK
ncbi:MAG: thiamine phosphate synthase [Nonlabens sp.]|uniref:thiamine phosphate synthase n=1 Tax=Nonlabens sp. TaxID=1888209 RepID=UPI003EF9470E